MKDFFNSILKLSKEKTKDIFLINFFLLFLIIIFFNFIESFINFKTPTDTLRYLNWTIETKNFNFLENVTYLINWRSEGIFYLITLYIFKFLDFFQIAILNIIALIICLNVIILDSKIDLKFYILIIGIFVFANLEFSRWMIVPLTEMLNFCMIFLTVYFFNKKKFIISFFLFFICLMMKPSSINLIAIIFQIFLFEKFMKNKSFYTKLFYFNFFIILIFTVIIYFKIDIIFLKTSFEFLNDMIKQGVVVHGRDHLNLKIDFSFIEILKLIFTKFFYYFNFWDSNFSYLHNFINTVVFLPMYLMTLLLIFKNKLSAEREKIFQTNVLFIFSYAVFHSLTWIDHDWRFRCVIILPLLYNVIIFFENYNHFFNIQKILKKINKP